MSTQWKGIALPFGTTIASVFDPKDDMAVLKSSVISIVLTGYGERPMFPEFGSPIGGMLFEPADAVTINAVRDQVRDAVARWDDRVTFVDFAVTKQQNTLHFVISWMPAKLAQETGIQIIEFSVTDAQLRTLR